jgi:hypothetical protein
MIAENFLCRMFDCAHFEDQLAPYYFDSPSYYIQPICTHYTNAVTTATTTII